MQNVLAAGGIIGLFAATATVLFRAMQREDGIADRMQVQLDHQATEIGLLRKANVRCERRVNVLIFACQQGGIQIPAEVWDGHDD